MRDECSKHAVGSSHPQLLEGGNLSRSMTFGGGRGIRTPEGLAALAVFRCSDWRVAARPWMSNRVLIFAG